MKTLILIPVLALALSAQAQTTPAPAPANPNLPDLTKLTPEQLATVPIKRSPGHPINNVQSTVNPNSAAASGSSKP